MQLNDDLLSKHAVLLSQLTNLESFLIKSFSTNFTISSENTKTVLDPLMNLNIKELLSEVHNATQS